MLSGAGFVTLRKLQTGELEVRTRQGQFSRSAAIRPGARDRVD
jgi:hypothetical protein